MNPVRPWILQGLKSEEMENLMKVSNINKLIKGGLTR